MNTRAIAKKIVKALISSHGHVLGDLQDIPEEIEEQIESVLDTVDTNGEEEGAWDESE
jgi:hypothetical protein